MIPAPPPPPVFKSHLVICVFLAETPRHCGTWTRCCPLCALSGCLTNRTHAAPCNPSTHSKSPMSVSTLVSQGDSGYLGKAPFCSTVHCRMPFPQLRINQVNAGCTEYLQSACPMPAAPGDAESIFHAHPLGSSNLSSIWSHQRLIKDIGGSVSQCSVMLWIFLCPSFK